MKERYIIDRAKDEKGVALLMVMVISAIVLAIMASMVYMLTSGTQISGLSKRFTTATEAAIGGQEVATAIIRSRGGDLAGLEAELNLAIVNAAGCFNDKLNKRTSEWEPTCDQSSPIDVTDENTYDVTFDLGGYDIYAKIIHTTEGNSGLGSGGNTVADFIGVVHGGGGSAGGGQSRIVVQHIPYYYTIEIDARNKANTSERARLSMLYEY